MAVSGKTSAPHEIPYFLDGDLPPDMAAVTKAIADRVHSRLEALLPAGSILATARSSAPSGYLICDGSAVSRTTYKTLFEAIGVANGAGNGSTTFNLPDLRGRVPVGVDGSAGRLTASDELGKAAGEEKHVLSLEETPAHSHSPSLGGQLVMGGAASANLSLGGGNFGLGSLNSAGGGKSHNNMQPYQVVNYMIKI